jgi:hypothetical protein
MTRNRSWDYFQSQCRYLMSELLSHRIRCATPSIPLVSSRDAVFMAARSR